ncbi:hypothetical protein VOLCADRAFT_87825 [Volvox carteri f. nagariensis]|uniref:Uncharacterized protein n=1 Tax=Volvox carteri f. nagariensis TaxID=3068 RepID=D8TMC5_VOLCA|nr:uncharacterized protein VOLCADRAFT_87825 [Volvox carteri f. nagariensis]EFJ51477.1 hypothetical protein VOLCADRAFT_87825 [Volvox carteri f. nagariensis]|eukprot:XP_002947429.1 hypothetical protein VOLCADRAFT_87825 [Volvox carteri f. nagariensis]
MTDVICEICGYDGAADWLLICRNSDRCCRGRHLYCVDNVKLPSQPPTDLSVYGSVECSLCSSTTVQASAGKKRGTAAAAAGNKTTSQRSKRSAHEPASGTHAVSSLHQTYTATANTGPADAAAARDQVFGSAGSVFARPEAQKEIAGGVGEDAGTGTGKISPRTGGFSLGHDADQVRPRQLYLVPHTGPGQPQQARPATATATAIAAGVADQKPQPQSQLQDFDFAFVDSSPLPHPRNATATGSAQVRGPSATGSVSQGGAGAAAGASAAAVAGKLAGATAEADGYLDAENSDSDSRPHKRAKVQGVASAAKVQARASAGRPMTQQPSESQEHQSHNQRVAAFGSGPFSAKAAPPSAAAPAPARNHVAQGKPGSLSERYKGQLRDVGRHTQMTDGSLPGMPQRSLKSVANPAAIAAAAAAGGAAAPRLDKQLDPDLSAFDDLSSPPQKVAGPHGSRGPAPAGRVVSSAGIRPGLYLATEASAGGALKQRQGVPAASGVGRLPLGLPSNGMGARVQGRPMSMGSRPDRGALMGPVAGGIGSRVPPAPGARAVRPVLPAARTFGASFDIQQALGGNKGAGSMGGTGPSAPVLPSGSTPSGMLDNMGSVGSLGSRVSTSTGPLGRGKRRDTRRVELWVCMLPLKVDPELLASVSKDQKDQVLGLTMQSITPHQSMVRLCNLLSSTVFSEGDLKWSIMQGDGQGGVPPTITETRDPGAAALTPPRRFYQSYAPCETCLVMLPTMTIGKGYDWFTKLLSKLKAEGCLLAVELAFLTPAHLARDPVLARLLSAQASDRGGRVADPAGPFRLYFMPHQVPIDGFDFDNGVIDCLLCLTGSRKHVHVMSIWDPTPASARGIKGILRSSDKAPTPKKRVDFEIKDGNDHEHGRLLREKEGYALKHTTALEGPAAGAYSGGQASTSRNNAADGVKGIKSSDGVINERADAADAGEAQSNADLAALTDTRFPARGVTARTQVPFGVGGTASGAPNSARTGPPAGDLAGSTGLCQRASDGSNGGGGGSGAQLEAQSDAAVPVASSIEAMDMDMAVGAGSQEVPTGADAMAVHEQGAASRTAAAAALPQAGATVDTEAAAAGAPPEGAGQQKQQIQIKLEQIEESGPASCKLQGVSFDGGGAAATGDGRRRKEIDIIPCEGRSRHAPPAGALGAAAAAAAANATTGTQAASMGPPGGSFVTAMLPPAPAVSRVSLPRRGHKPAAAGTSGTIPGATATATEPKAREAAESGSGLAAMASGATLPTVAAAAAAPPGATAAPAPAAKAPQAPSPAGITESEPSTAPQDLLPVGLAALGPSTAAIEAAVAAATSLPASAGGGEEAQVVDGPYAAGEGGFTVESSFFTQFTWSIEAVGPVAEHHARVSPSSGAVEASTRRPEVSEMGTQPHRLPPHLQPLHPRHLRNPHRHTLAVANGDDDAGVANNNINNNLLPTCGSTTGDPMGCVINEQLPPVGIWGAAAAAAAAAGVRGLGEGEDEARELLPMAGSNNPVEEVVCAALMEGNAQHLQSQAQRQLRSQACMPRLELHHHHHHHQPLQPGYDGPGRQVGIMDEAEEAVRERRHEQDEDDVPMELCSPTHGSTDGVSCREPEAAVAFIDTGEEPDNRNGNGKHIRSSKGSEDSAGATAVLVSLLQKRPTEVAAGAGAAPVPLDSLGGLDKMSGSRSPQQQQQFAVQWRSLVPKTLLFPQGSLEAAGGAPCEAEAEGCEDMDLDLVEPGVLPGDMSLMSSDVELGTWHDLVGKPAHALEVLPPLEVSKMLPRQQQHKEQEQQQQAAVLKSGVLNPALRRQLPFLMSNLHALPRMPLRGCQVRLMASGDEEPELAAALDASAKELGFGWSAWSTDIAPEDLSGVQVLALSDSVVHAMSCPAATVNGLILKAIAVHPILLYRAEALVKGLRLLARDARRRCMATARGLPDAKPLVKLKVEVPSEPLTSSHGIPASRYSPTPSPSPSPILEDVLSLAQVDGSTPVGDCQPLYPTRVVVVMDAQGFLGTPPKLLRQLTGCLLAGSRVWGQPWLLQMREAHIIRVQTHGSQEHRVVLSRALDPDALTSTRRGSFGPHAPCGVVAAAAGSAADGRRLPQFSVLQPLGREVESSAAGSEAVVLKDAEKVMRLRRPGRLVVAAYADDVEAKLHASKGRRRRDILAGTVLEVVSFLDLLLSHAWLEQKGKF